MPVRIVNFVIRMHVDPYFALSVILYTAVLLVKAVKCTADNAVNVICRGISKLGPLTLLD